MAIQSLLNMVAPGVALAQSQTGIFWKKQAFAFTTTTGPVMGYRRQIQVDYL